MHDPLAVAHELKKPWRKYRSRDIKDAKKKDHTSFMSEFERTYRESWLTIWHRDPEIGGSDDSCGWFTPPFSKELRDIIQSLASDEAREPWFAAKQAQRHNDPVVMESLIRGAFVLVSRCMKNRGLIRREVSMRKIQRWTIAMTHNSVDNYRSSLCFLSGYHSNWYRDNEPNTEEEDKFWRQEQATSFFSSIAGFIQRDRRWWFQHPRWHVWHWSFQLHALQAFKRWVFSRCASCGKRFPYGYSPVTTNWNGDKARWFRGETHTYHSECCPVSSRPASSSTEVSVL